MVKVNTNGKRQQRLFKLTCDSLLNIANNKIKTEISFAGIQSVCLDPTTDNAVLLHYKVGDSQIFACPLPLVLKGENDPHQIFCAHCDEFVKSVRQLLARFNAVRTFCSTSSTTDSQFMFALSIFVAR